MTKYICTTCLFKADTGRKIKEQVLFFTMTRTPEEIVDRKLEIYHKDCALKGAEDKGEHFEISGVPKEGRMVHA